MANPCKTCLETHPQAVIRAAGYDKPHTHSEDGKCLIFDYPELAAIIAEMPRQHKDFLLPELRGFSARLEEELK